MGDFAALQLRGQWSRIPGRARRQIMPHYWPQWEIILIFWITQTTCHVMENTMPDLNITVMPPFKTCRSLLEKKKG